MRKKIGEKLSLLLSILTVPMSSSNANKIMAASGEHVTNLNHSLKNTKLSLSIDFI